MAHTLDDKCPRHFCITIALSLLSYYYFEKPANRWVKRILTKNNHKLAPWNYQQKHPELK